MLKEKWEDKNGINLPAHTSCSNNMVIQPLQVLSNNGHITGSSSKINVATLTSPGSTLTSVEPASFKHQFPQQSHISETRTGQSLVDPNLQQLIKFLSANYGPSKTPLEIGTPEYLKLVEILKQSSTNGGGPSVEKLSGGSKDGGTNNTQNVDKPSLIVDKSSTGRNNQEQISSSEKAADQLWDGTLQLSSSVTLSAVAFFKSGEKLVGNYWPEFIEVKGKVRLQAFEKYVQDLPRSRNRGLMVTSICWNEGSSNIGLNGMKEVAKGYKKSSRVGFAHLLSGIDLYICPRSDPIITILAKHGFFKGMSVLDDKLDSMIGCVVWRKNRPLNPVGNTSDDKSSPSSTQPQDSPPGFSSKQGVENKLLPEKAESSQREEPLTLPLTIACPEVDSSSSSADVDPCNSMLNRKRPFEDDDLPEFDFAVACVKSTLVSKPANSPKQLDNNNNNNINNNNNNIPLIQLPAVVNAIEWNNNDGSLNPSLKKTKLFDDDDMPEWRPPQLHNHNQPPPQSTTSNIQNLPVYPPLPPLPPPPAFPPPPRVSYLPFRPPSSSQQPVFVRPQQPLPPPPPLQPLPPPPQPPPRPSGMFGANQVLWHRPSFPASNGRRPQL